MAVLTPPTSLSADGEQTKEESYETSKEYKKHLCYRMFITLFHQVYFCEQPDLFLVTAGWFRLPSPSSEATRKTAETLVEWLEDPGHRRLFDQFAVNLTAKFKLFFIKAKHLNQAKMWVAYHKLRTSSSFSEELGGFFGVEHERKGASCSQLHCGHIALTWGL